VYVGKDDHTLSLYLGWTVTLALSILLFHSQIPFAGSALLSIAMIFLGKRIGMALSIGEDYIGYLINLALWNRSLKQYGRLLCERQMNGRAYLSELEKRIMMTYGSRAFDIDTEECSLTLTAPDDPVTQISIVPLPDDRYSIQVELYHCRLEDRIPPFDLAVDRQVDWEQLTDVMGQYVRTKTK